MKRLINKQLKGLIGIVLTSTLFIACSSENQISSSFSQEEITQAINNDRWNFTAEHAMPSYGSSRIVTGVYTVRLRGDSLSVSLPYYGKLNSAAGAMNGNPLDFRSTNFKKEKQEKKAGEWIVTISRPDAEVQSMLFTFFDNGTAQANIVMTNRTGINFSGKVTPGK
jgi:hypothetical protein